MITNFLQKPGVGLLQGLEADRGKNSAAAPAPHIGEITENKPSFTAPFKQAPSHAPGAKPASVRQWLLALWHKGELSNQQHLFQGDPKRGKEN